MLPTKPISPSFIDRSQFTQSDTPFVWTVPGSKSLTNRALILAAVAAEQSGQPCHIHSVLHSDDTRHMQNCLRQLGAEITCSAETIDPLNKSDSLTIAVPHGFKASSEELFVGNSGTTVRFLAALCATIPGSHHLVGDQHMAKRPIGDLVGALRDQGVDITCDTGCPHC